MGETITCPPWWGKYDREEDEWYRHTTTSAPAFSLLNVFFLFNGVFLASSQPTQDLDPEDTEAIIAAFLNNATEQGWNDTTVNDMLEEIL